MVKRSDNKGWNIARYFYDNTGNKCTPAIFRKATNQINELLTCGYTEEEIKKSIDWLINNPPREGFHSVGYLNYAINAVLEQIKIEENKKIIEKQEKIIQEFLPTEEKPVKVENDYAKKFFGGI